MFRYSDWSSNEFKKDEKRSIHCHNGLSPIIWKSQEENSSRKIQPWYNSFMRIKIEDIYYCSNCGIIN